MNKPIAIKMNEATLQIVDILNKSELPAFCLKTIVKDILKEIDSAEQQEIQKYQEYLKEQNKKGKKGSGK